MTTYSVNWQAIEDGQDAIARAQKNFSNELTNLEQSTETELKYWTGGSRDIYYDRKRKWDQEVADMLQKLQKANPILDQIQANYMKMENAL